MSDPTEKTKPGILYVDDEEKALKYFAKAFSRDFRVFTANNAGDGIKILEQEAESIALIVSDQRMPETTGVEFLTEARDLFPHKVRILTTAYSDLDSAIQSVNQGRIYQYVVKPWDLQDFQMILRRAYDYYSLLTERNELMSIKMSTFQRIVLADRTKTLQLLASSLAAPAGTDLTTALYSLIIALPATVETNPARAGQAFLRGGLRDFMRQEREAHEKILTFWNSANSADTDPLTTLAGRLRENFAGLECQIDPQGPDKKLSLDLGSVSQADLLHALFGVLTEASPSEVALALLRTLPSLEAESARLKIEINGEEWIKFAPKSISEHYALEEELSSVYDQWDSLSL
ncbi:MAG: response regulator [Puniceicoccales bacterium]